MIMSMVMGFLVLLLVAWILPSCIVITSQKEVSIIETFGRFSNIKESGLAFKWPYPIQRVVSVIETRLMQLPMNLSLKTKDNLFITYPVNVQYYVFDAVKANYELNDHEEQIKSYVSNIIRTEVSKREFLELYNVKGEIQEEVVKELRERMESYGFNIKDVLVDEPIPTEEVQASFNNVTASIRRKEAAKNDAEASRIQIVGEATAYSEAKELSGIGLAKQRNAIADGMSESVKKLCDGLNITSSDAMALIMQTNKCDAMVEASKNEGTVILSDIGVNSENNELREYLKNDVAMGQLKAK